MEFTEDELHAFLGTMPEEPETQSQGDQGPEGEPGVPEELVAEEQPGTPAEQKEQPPEAPAPDYEAEKQAAVQQAVAEAVAREREKAQDEWKAFFTRAGLKNSISGAEITSREEFEEWYRAYEAAKLERELKEGRLTPEALQQAARRAVEEQARQAAPPPPQEAPGTGLARPQGSAGAAQAMPKQDVTPEQVQQELAAIHQMDESISTLEDIAKMPTWGAFQDAVMRRGCSFVEAFRLANFDAIMARQREDTAKRAAQAAVNNARSKDHLAASKSKGAGAVAVPGDELDLYRRMNPGKSEAEIQEHYNQYIKLIRKGA